MKSCTQTCTRVAPDAPETGPIMHLAPKAPENPNSTNWIPKYMKLLDSSFLEIGADSAEQSASHFGCIGCIPPRRGSPDSDGVARTPEAIEAVWQAAIDRAHELSKQSESEQDHDA